MSVDCLICHARSEPFTRATILGKYEVQYFRCGECHFIQTETPYWLDEAYADAIVSSDVGLVSRNQHYAQIVDRVLRFALPTSIRCIDYGGGYGMFTRMMRDRGHHFFHFDPHCRNLFADGFTARRDENSFDFLTAFEVFEHLADPHAELQRLDQMAENWFVSTEVVPDPPPKPDQWWYYVLDGGQHISLWSRRALEIVAKRYNRNLISYRGMHLFCVGSLNPHWVRLLMRNRGSRLLDTFRRRRSLLQDDFQRALTGIQRAA
jgi:hypothetical protein